MGKTVKKIIRKTDREPVDCKGKIKYQKRILEEEETKQLIDDYLYLLRDIGEGTKNNDSREI